MKKGEKDEAETRLNKPLDKYLRTTISSGSNNRPVLSQDIPITQKHNGFNFLMDEHTLRKIVRDEVSKWLSLSGNGSRTVYRKRKKNERVVYIPNEPTINQVLETLRTTPNEPLRITIKRVFAVAAKQLGVQEDSS